MGLRTPLCDLLGVDVPIGNAGMGGGTAGPKLAAAVAEAGGMAGLGGIYSEGPERLRAEIRTTRELTSRFFSVNLWCWLLDLVPQFLDVCIEEGVPSVTLTFGAPGVHMERAKAAGLVVLFQAQTVAGAQEAAAGADVVIAQGGEAGGHTGSVATMALVPSIVDAIGEIPVIAAGGIADGRGVVAATALGAQGVIMGTRFIASTEAQSPVADHQQLIVAATADDTVQTDVFDIVAGGTFPSGISGRSIRTPFSDEWHGREQELRAMRDAILAESTVANELPERAQAVYAGQSSGLIHHVQPAGEILRDVVRDAEAVLQTLTS
jgi:NAD(P)H-dependent flavin oxidoreductase YrpB (nitropropane dioxygenase family)